MQVWSSVCSISKYSASWSRSRGWESFLYSLQKWACWDRIGATVWQQWRKWGNWVGVFMRGCCIGVGVDYYINRFCIHYFISKVILTFPTQLPSMNQKPVQLSEKIDYLNQKIFKVHTQIRKSQDLELRLNFQQYIDICIREILTIRDQSSPRKPKNPDKETPNEAGRMYSVEHEKLEFEKKIVNYQMKELENRQLEMEYQTMKIKLYNKEREYQKLEAEILRTKMENVHEMKRLLERNKILEQEIEKLVKLNRAQQEQIKMVKAQRNRAEQKQLQIQQKYDDDIGKLQKFGDKKPRYIDRTTQGLKCTHSYTNIGTSGPKFPKILILKLPTVLQVQKLVYGIMLGVQLNNKQILYYDKVPLYEKQLTQVQLENEAIVLTYKRRKDNIRVVLDKYVVRVPEIAVMLYGKGDSLLVHDIGASGSSGANGK